MNAGDTFLVPDRDDHLWMVISDPSKDSGQVVVVCFLSWQDHYDQSCVLYEGEHPYIKHPTCVNFLGARKVPGATLDRLAGEGKIKPKDRLSAALLDKIRASAVQSDIPLECYEVLREQGFVE